MIFLLALLLFHFFLVGMFFFETVSVYSRDTNAHVNLKYNFGHHCKHYGLREVLFWHNEQISLFRAPLAKLGKLLMCMLLVIRSITGCGTTSKVVTKGKAFKMACNERQIAKLREHNLGMEIMNFLWNALEVETRHSWKLQLSTLCNFMFFAIKKGSISR